MLSKNTGFTCYMAKTAPAAGGCKCLKINGGAEGDRTPSLRIANAFQSVPLTTTRSHWVLRIQQTQPSEGQFPIHRFL